ncbi:TPA: hypothetical protein ACH3X2_007995 [Trebouxia sp. C0005]
MPHTLHLCEQSQHVNGTRKMHKDRWALSWLPPPGSYYLQTRSGCTAAAVANAAQEVRLAALHDLHGCMADLNPTFVANDRVVVPVVTCIVCLCNTQQQQH